MYIFLSLVACLFLKIKTGTDGVVFIICGWSPRVKRTNTCILEQSRVLLTASVNVEMFE